MIVCATPLKQLIIMISLIFVDNWDITFKLNTNINRHHHTVSKCLTCKNTQLKRCSLNDSRLY